MTQHGTSGLYRLTAALLAFVMLFSALPWTVAAQGDSGTAAISPADIPEGLTAEQLASHGAVSRLRQEETDEYTFVFLNNDGTRTSYSYGVPVKYADENGVMHDKNNTIKAFNSEYGNTAGDVELRFPQKLNKVRIGYKGHSIQISPVTEVSTGHISAVVSGNTVVYPGAFGQGIDLRYASVMSGIKEDIILQNYSGKNSFSFEIKTGGLALDEINGQYAITDGEEIIFSFGDLEVLDSFTGENEAEDNWDEHRTTAQGEIVTLKENDRYIFTITVTDDFLTSPSTVYPVYIDPSFNVARQYITDTYIAQGYTNNYVNASLVAVGYGTNSKNIRTVAKITSLYGGNTVQGRITSAYYSMYCTSNYSSSPTVDAYCINDNISWNPSTATWQNSADLIMNNSTKISTLTVGGAGRYNFDITAAYQSWQMGQVNNGIMLRMTTEVSGKYRQFASANVSDSSKLAYITVTYDYSAIGVQLHETFSYMTIGQTKQLTALVYPAGMTELTWSSSNTSVAEVTSGGLITAKAAGSAVITARSVYDESKYAQCEIEVVAVGVSSVTLPYNSVYVPRGNTLTVSTLILPANATVKTLNWYSDNTSVATVTNGVITAVAPGTATITVRSVQGAKSDSMTVIVPKYEIVNYYDSTFVNNATMINNITLANNFLREVVLREFGVYVYMDGSATQYTNALADQCPLGVNEPCYSFATGNRCSQIHHKNTVAISNQLYNDQREDNHIYVMWSDRNVNVYCLEEYDPSDPNSISFHHTDPDIIAMVINSRPVIQFLSITDCISYVDDEIIPPSNEEVKACMAIVLVHEFMHTLGMPDVYDNPGHDQNGTTCIMERFERYSACEFYSDILASYNDNDNDNDINAFCDSCRATLMSLVQNGNITGNLDDYQED